MPLGEFELIARFFADGFTDRDDIVLGVGDDAAVVRVPAGSELVAAADTIVCGVHFPVETAAEHIGHRALAVNLSDLAAMGAAPCWCTLALTLPAVDERWLQDFTRGFRELAVRHGVALIGGDTTRGPLTLTVQLLGLVPGGTAIRRSGARAGELVFVSGTMGDAAAGLALIQKEVRGASPEHEAYLRQRSSHPRPALNWGSHCAESHRRPSTYRTVCTPTSQAAGCERGGSATRSGSAAVVTRSAGQPGAERARRLALSGGDDYELCFTVPVERAGEAERAAIAAGCPIHRIGVIEASAGVRYLENGRPASVDAPGYDHFR